MCLNSTLLVMTFPMLWSCHFFLFFLFGLIFLSDRTIIGEYGMSEEVVNAVSNFIGADISEVQVVKISFYTNLCPFVVPLKMIFSHES